MHIFHAMLLLTLCMPLMHEAKASVKDEQAPKKKKKPSYPVPNKKIKDMNIQELELVADYGKTVKDSELVYKVYYHLLGKSQDHERIRVYKLDLADYCFSQEEYEKAGSKYEEFCVLYPGAADAEYCHYKMVLCFFFLSLDADKDQTNTGKTIDNALLFLKHAKNAKFIDEIKTIYKTCRKRLFEHEVIIFDTYLKQQKFVGAEKRLEFIEAHFSDIEHIEKYISYLHAIYERIKNPSTRPFIFKINLEHALDATAQQTQKEEQPKAVQKATSYFVA